MGRGFEGSGSAPKAGSEMTAHLNAARVFRRRMEKPDVAPDHDAILLINKCLECRGVTGGVTGAIGLLTSSHLARQGRLAVKMCMPKCRMGATL